MAGASVTVELPRCREPGVPQKTNTQKYCFLTMCAEEVDGVRRGRGENELGGEKGLFTIWGRGSLSISPLSARVKV